MVNRHRSEHVQGSQKSLFAVSVSIILTLKLIVAHRISVWCPSGWSRAELLAIRDGWNLLLSQERKLRRG